MDGDRTANQPTEQEKLDRARERVAEIKGFFIHLTIFACVLIILFGVDWMTGEGWWVQWVFIGWGIGVLAHALVVFGSTPGFISRWEERKIREYVDKS